ISYECRTFRARGHNLPPPAPTLSLSCPRPLTDPASARGRSFWREPIRASRGTNKGRSRQMGAETGRGYWGRGLSCPVLQIVTPLRYSFLEENELTIFRGYFSLAKVVQYFTKDTELAITG
uniref:Uncharacterized protein n=1 Tax=Junco hyemalis TaxID=40217 RepID=A0A8C5NK80_JUNHY